MRSASVILLLWLALPALADPPDARTIVERMKTALEPARSSTRKLTIVVSERGADSAQWVAGQARRRVGDANRMLTAMLAPEGVRGVAFLATDSLLPVRREFHDPAGESGWTMSARAAARNCE
jgi:hypothetical protein